MSKSSKVSKPARKSGGGAALMQQMGFQIPNFDESGMGDDDDDLEAELRRLQQGSEDGNQRSRGSKSDQRKLGGMAQDLQLFHNDVNKLLRDIDRPINDDELSDVDDDELLAELNEITDEIETERNDQIKQPQAKSSGNIVSVLEERQSMYAKALAAAKASGDAAKSRRLDRQLKTIQELLQSARAGAPVNESEIPPEVFIASQSASVPQQTSVRAPSPPQQPAAPRSRAVPLPQPPTQASIRTNNNNNPAVFQPQAPPTSTDSDSKIARLKSLALQAKQQGDMAKAKEYIIQLRTLQGKAISTVSSSSMHRETYDNVPEDDGPPPALPLKAPEPRTIMEALQQRHEELTKRGEEAARSGDNSKARRMERLSKQYEEAIDATRKGRPYNYSELPDLPGFAPIPVQQSKPQPVAASSTATAARPAPSNTQVRSSQAQQQRTVPTAASTNPISTRKSQQAQTLRLKQEKFQKLAVQAKQKGDLETAKKFLVAYKGLDQMIVAAESGLPIDMSQVPKLPDDDNDMIDDDDLTQDLARSDRDTIYRRLQEDLLKQIQLCARNQQIYSQMEGINNVKYTNEYKVLEQRCANDLEKLRQCFQHGLKPPLFHYERRQMTIVQVNSDLGDNDLEVNILRGINLPVPQGQSASSLETYVFIEFPYPTETPQTARTRLAVGSVNAEYPDSLHKFYIKRNDAKFRRLMNRKELKLAVFYKAGFLRSDRPLGIASIKLAELEQACTIHESVDLYESEHKKKIEGKLEVKLRIKEALGQTKASDILPQRWLVIDRFEEFSPHAKSSSTSKSSAASAPAITAIARLIPTGDILGQLAINMAENRNNDEVVDSSQSNASELTNHQRRRKHQHQEPASSSTSTSPQSVQVLNYEASLIQQQIEQLHDRLTHDQLHQLKMKRREIEEQSDRLVEFLRMGGKQAVQEHVRGLEELNDYYDQEAREYHQRRETKKADIALTKKKLVMKEIDTLTGQPSSTRF
ncbi:unnamed protein product [Rotaria sp. Silwood1]|nr:unnamed protein product [Rotaria sp. Silwood1]CAF1070617.1 unnamed protein product [Rotaria sp. Silwood1]CAF3393851.1 unnamed protein product [Rotaria sp. Silwood1]CAF3410768.1 unnamed protein product [Rotaria sp. Silwood1]CAF4643810.1 unnamed protein product [Rotaria sp. Silwood1]